MAAPAPYNGVSGRNNLSNYAIALRGHYEWLYRWSDEMNTDAQLDLKKLAQFIYRHCLGFQAAYAALNDANAGPVMAAAVRTEFADQGIAWPDDATMKADLTTINNACNTMYTWVENNFPQAKSFATRTFDAQGNEIEVPNVVTKPAGLQTRINQFRALFA